MLKTMIIRAETCDLQVWNLDAYLTYRLMVFRCNVLPFSIFIDY